MKCCYTPKVATAVIALILLLPLSSFAATWLVDNDVNNDAANFHALQPALDAAADGDTVYLMPSLTSYGDVLVSKEVNLIGAGFGSNPTEGIFSKVDQLNIAAGTDSVFITGIYFTDGNEIEFNAPVSYNATRDTISNVTLYRNRLSALKNEYRTGQVANLRVVNNYFGGSLSGVWLGYDDTPFSTKRYLVVGLYFVGNVINNADLKLEDDVVAGIVSNNVFKLNLADSIATGDVDFLNNLCWATDLSNVSNKTPKFNNSTIDDYTGRIENNCFTGLFVTLPGTAPVEEGNFIESDITKLVVDTGNWGELFLPVAQSLLVGAGTDGSDIGAFGGSHPWNLGNQPPLPFITEVTGPAIVNPGQGFSLTVDIESSN